MKKVFGNLQKRSNMPKGHKGGSVFLLSLMVLVLFISGCGVQTSPTVCEHDYYRSDYVPAAGTQNGYSLYTCRKCGNSFREVVPATGGGVYAYEQPVTQLQLLPNGSSTADMSAGKDSVTQAEKNTEAVGGTSKYSTKIELFSLPLYSYSASLYEPKYVSRATDSKGFKHEDVYLLATSWGGNDYIRYELGGSYKKLIGTIYIMDQLNGTFPAWLEFYDAEDFLFSTQKLSSGRNSCQFEIDLEGVEYLTIYPVHSEYYGNTIICQDFFLYK